MMEAVCFSTGVDRFRERMGVWLALLFLSAAGVPGLAGELRGTVLRADGTAGRFLTIEAGLLSNEFARVGFDSSDGAGAFAITGLPAGEYTLRTAEESAGNYDVWLGDAPVVGSDALAAGALSVTLTSTGVVTNLVLRMCPGGVVRGKVADGQGRAVSNVTVYAHTSATSIRYRSNVATTDANGDYAFAYRPTTSLVMRVLSQDIVSELYEDVAYINSSSYLSTAPVTRVSVGCSTTTTVDFSVCKEAQFSGTVTDTQGNPVRSASVRFKHEGGTSTLSLGVGQTDFTYSAPFFATSVFVQARATDYHDKWWGMAGYTESTTPPDDATELSANCDDLYDGIDIMLCKYPEFSVRVVDSETGLDVPDATLRGYVPATGDTDSDSSEDTNEAYQVQMETNEFIYIYAQAPGYESAWYGDAPYTSRSNYDTDGATPTAGDCGDTFTYTIRLCRQPVFNVRVEDALTGRVISNARVYAYNPDPYHLVSDNSIDTNDVYSPAVNTNAATYLYASGSGYETRWYGDVDYTGRSNYETDGATALSGDCGDEFDGLVIRLCTNAPITGVVTDQDGVPLEDVAVRAYRTNGAYAGIAYTDTNGVYTRILSEGLYLLQASAPGYDTEWYDDLNVSTALSNRTVVTHVCGVGARADFELCKRPVVHVEVVDAVSGLILSNARAYVYSPSPFLHTSDGTIESNRYSMVFNTNAVTYVYATAPGYQSRWYGDAPVFTVNNAAAEGATPVVGDCGYEETVRINLCPFGVATGRVVDTEGDPVAGATVRFRHQGGSLSTSTDAQGSYSRVLGPETYTIEVSKSKYVFHDSSAPITFVCGEVIETNVEMCRFTEYAVRVVDDATGQVIDNARLVGYQPDNNDVESDGDPDTNGTWRVEFYPDPNEPVYLYATAPGYGPRWYGDVVYRGSRYGYEQDGATPLTGDCGTYPAQLEIRLCTNRTVSGTVLGTDGTPVEGAYVRMNSVGNGYSYQGNTDSNGMYRIEVSEGRYHAYAERNGSHDRAYYDDVLPSDPFEDRAVLEVTCASADISGIDFSLCSWPVYRVRVVDIGSGAVISNASVYAFDPPNRYDADFEDQIGADDRYHVRQNPGEEAYVYATAPGYGARWYDAKPFYSRDRYFQDDAAAVTGDCGDLVDLTIELCPLGAVEGRVVDQDGQPLEGVSVDLFTTFGFHAGSGLSDSNGTYSVAAPEGEFRVFASKFGYLAEYYDDAPFHAEPGDFTAVDVGCSGTVSGIDFELCEYATFSVRVVDANTGLVVSNAEVWGYSSSPFGDQSFDTALDSNDTWQVDLPSLAPAYLWAEAPGYGSRWYGGVPHYRYYSHEDDGAAAVTGDCGTVNGVYEIALCPDGAVSGRVVDQDGAPLEGVRVTVYPDTFGDTETEFTDSNGVYRVAAPEGVYTVRARRNGYVTEYYDDVPETDGTTPRTEVAIVCDSETNGIDFALCEFVELQVRVVDALDGRVISNASVRAEIDGSWEDSDSSIDTNDVYDLHVEPHQDVAVRASSSGYGPRWYGNIPYTGSSSDEPDTVTGDCGDVASLTIALCPLGTISGVVTDQDGQPVSGHQVVVRHAASGGWEGEADTDADGRYEIPVGDGEFWVYAQGFPYGLEYYDDKPSSPVEGRTVVNAPCAGNVSNINFELCRRHELTGVVLDAEGDPVEDAYVVARFINEDGQDEFAHSDHSNFDGSFTVFAEPEVSEVYLVVSSVDGHFPTWHDGTPRRDATYTVAGAQLAPLIGDCGEVTSNIVLRACQYPLVSGRVIDQDGVPQEDVEVYAHAYTGGGNFTRTDSNGNYEVRLPVIDDAVVVQANWDDGRTRNWHDLPPRRDELGIFDDATLVPLLDCGQVVTGVDIRVCGEAAVAGTVRDPGGFPVPNAMVTLHQPDSGYEVTVQADIDGRYEIPVQWTGPLAVRADADGYAPEWYNDISYLHESQLDEVIPIARLDPGCGVTQTADFVLCETPTIEGTATLGGQPVEGAHVTAVVTEDGGSWHVASAFTDSNGIYRLANLPAPAEIRVSISANGAASVSTGPVSVVCGSSHTGLDFELCGFSELSGVVTGPSGEPINNAEVRLYNEFGNRIRSLYTDTSGMYQVRTLETMVWLRVQAVGYEPEWLGDVPYTTGGREERESSQRVDLPPCDGVVSNLDFSLDACPLASVSGRVLDHEGDPATFRNVRLVDSNFVYRGFDRTDSQGDYLIQTEFKGPVYVLVEGGGDARAYYPAGHAVPGTIPPEAQPLALDCGTAHSNVNIDLCEPHRIRVRVVDTAGDPIASGRVELHDTVTGYDGQYHTGSDGYIELTRTPGASYRFLAEPSGHLPNWAGRPLNRAESNVDDHEEEGSVLDTVCGGSNELEIVLCRGGAVSGTVVDQDGNPIRYPNVRIYNLTEGTLHYASEGFDGDFFETGLPVGHRIAVYASEFNYESTWYGQAPFTDEPHALADGATILTVPDCGLTISNLEITLCHLPPVTGTVVNSAGEPVPFATVLLYNPLVGVVASDTADYLGRFSVEPRSSGTHYAYGSQTPNYFDTWYGGGPRISSSAPEREIAGATPIPVACGVQQHITIVMCEASILRGTVTTEGGIPIPDTAVTLHEEGAGSRTVSTGFDGSYVFNTREAGTYRVYASHGQYANEWYNDIPAGSSSLPTPYQQAERIELTKGQHLAGVDFELGSLLCVTGRVTDSTGTPVATSVDLYEWDPQYEFPQYYGSTLSGEDGRYLLEDIDPGTYFVLAGQYFPGGDPDHIAAWYNGVPAQFPALGNATPVVVTDRCEVVDIQLLSGALICGKVTDPDGNMIEGAYVEVVDGNFRYVDFGQTDSNGMYRLAVPPGVYHVYAGAYPRYRYEWYGGWPDPSGFGTDPLEEGSVPIEVESPGEKITADFELEPYVAISGRVTWADSGEPIQSAEVVALDGAGANLGIDLTDSQGRYVIYLEYPVPGGFLRARSGTSEEWHDGTMRTGGPAEDGVSPIPLTDGTSWDFQLDPDPQVTPTNTASISGYGMGAEGAVERFEDFDLYDADGNRLRTDYTGNDGRYHFDVPPGTYYVSMRSAPDIWYGQAFRQSDPLADMATPITVAAGEHLVLRNITNVPRHRVEGFVRDSAGRPLDDRTVRITGTGDLSSYSQILSTDPAGHYDADLPAGSYHVVALAGGLSGHLDTWYGDVVASPGSTPTGDGAMLLVVAGHTAGVDIQLQGTAGRITGTVTDPDGNPAHTDVTVFRGSELVTVVRTRVDGTYLVDPLPPGDYRVMAGGNGVHADTFHNGGAAVQLASGASLSNIDIQLARGGRVTGTLVDEATGDAIPGSRMELVNEQGSVLFSSPTSPDGLYHFFGVPLDSYYLRSSSPTNWVDEYNGDVEVVVGPLADGASPVVLTQAQSAQTHMIALAQGEPPDTVAVVAVITSMAHQEDRLRLGWAATNAVQYTVYQSPGIMPSNRVWTVCPSGSGPDEQAVRTATEDGEMFLNLINTGPPWLYYRIEGRK